MKARFQIRSSCDAAQNPEDASTMCQVEAYRVTQGYSIPWLRPDRIYLRVGYDVTWDNVPSMVHVTSLEAVAGILMVGMVRAMGQSGGRNAVMFSPISQQDPRAVAGMVHEGHALNYEIHLDVASMVRKDEEVYASFSGWLTVMNDVHYTEITHVTLLHAGDKVVVYCLLYTSPSPRD